MPSFSSYDPWRDEMIDNIKKAAPTNQELDQAVNQEWSDWERKQFASMGRALNRRQWEDKYQRGDVSPNELRPPPQKSAFESIGEFLAPAITDEAVTGGLNQPSLNKSGALADILGWIDPEMGPGLAAVKGVLGKAGSAAIKSKLPEILAAISGIVMKSKTGGEQAFKKAPKHWKEVIEYILSKEPAYFPIIPKEGSALPFMAINPPTASKGGLIFDLLSKGSPTPSRAPFRGVSFLNKINTRPMISLEYKAPITTVKHEDFHDFVKKLGHHMTFPEWGGGDINYKYFQKTGQDFPVSKIDIGLERLGKKLPNLSENYGKLAYGKPLWPRRAGEEGIAYSWALDDPAVQKLFMGKNEQSPGLNEYPEEIVTLLDYLKKSKYGQFLDKIRGTSEKMIPPGFSTDITGPNVSGIWGWPTSRPSTREVYGKKGKLIEEPTKIPGNWLHYGIE